MLLINRLSRLWYIPNKFAVFTCKEHFKRIFAIHGRKCHKRRLVDYLRYHTLLPMCTPLPLSLTFNEPKTSVTSIAAFLACANKTSSFKEDNDPLWWKTRRQQNHYFLLNEIFSASNSIHHSDNLIILRERSDKLTYMSTVLRFDNVKCDLFD